MSSEWSRCQTADHVKVAALGQTVRWHKDCILPFRAAIKLASRTEYGKWLLGRKELWDVQTYACREVRGGSGHSEHSHPVALDVRPGSNPMRDDGILITDYDRFGLDDGEAFVNAFIWCGFRSGIAYYTIPEKTRSYLAQNGKKIRDGRVDPMHFEFAHDKQWIEKNRDYLEDILEETEAPTWYAVITRRFDGTNIAHCKDIDQLVNAVFKIGRGSGGYYTNFSVPKG